MKLRKRISPSLVVSIAAVVIASSGSAIAAGLITGSQVKDNSLTGKDIKNNSLSGHDIRDRSLTPSDFKGSVAGVPGPAGSQGSVGPKGETGATGAAGANGSPGISGRHIVVGSPVSVPDDSGSQSVGTSATADCPAGESALGGGFNTSNNAYIVFLKDLEISDTGITATLSNYYSGGSPVTLRAHVVCAKVAS